MQIAFMVPNRHQNKMAISGAIFQNLFSISKIINFFGNLKCSFVDSLILIFLYDKKNQQTTNDLLFICHENYLKLCILQIVSRLYELRFFKSKTPIR